MNSFLPEESHRFDQIKDLVKRGIRIPNEAFLFAVNHNHLETVKFLVKNGMDVRVENNEALKFSVIYGYKEMTKYLIDNGAFPQIGFNIPIELQDQVIKNNVNSIIFIKNLREDLKEKYSGHIGLAEIGL